MITVRTGYAKYAMFLALMLFCGIAAFGWQTNTIVVTTSMLEAAVYDAARADTPPHVARLIPPGSCPGHFDLKPKMLTIIRRADLFVIHSYQRGIERKVAGLKAGVPMVIAEENGSYLVPSNYVKLVKFVAHSCLTENGDERIHEDSVAVRMWRLDEEWRNAAKRNGWDGVPVIASAMQADFCRWLGFNVVGEITRPSAMAPNGIDELLHAGAKLVVGNRQSDISAACALAKRLKVPLAELSNFPETSGKHAYERLAAKNMKELERVWARR